MKRKISILVTLVLVMSIISVGCATKPAASDSQTASDEFKAMDLKLSVTTSETSSWTLGANKFAELVNERSNGKINVKIYPNEQLSGGNIPKGIEMLQQGATDMSIHSSLAYSTLVPKTDVISLPWMFADEADADKKLDGPAGDKIKEILKEKNIQVLAIGENGFRQITNSKREIKTPADLVGLKIRVPLINMYVSLYKLLGADPVAMNFAEVFTSLQQKTIDGQENPLDLIYSSKFQEVQKYITLWNYSYDCLFLSINKDKFDTLDKKTQDLLSTAAKEAMVYQRQVNRANGVEQLKAFKDAGMIVTKLTPEQVKQFQDKVMPLYTSEESRLGKDLMDLFMK